MPNSSDRITKRFHLFIFAELLPYKVSIHQFLVINADGHQQSIFHGSVEERLDDDAEHAQFRHARTTCACTSTFQEEFKIVTAAQTLLHVGVEDGAVDEVATALHRRDASLYEEGAQTSQK